MGDIPVEVSENSGALPLWYSVSQAYPAGEGEEDMRRNANSLFDFSKGCFIQGKQKARSYEARNVKIVKRHANRVELFAESLESVSSRGETAQEGPALLVSSEAAYPGWEFVNEWGQKRSLETVNHVFRGVLLEPGEMHVSLRFEPTSFR